MKCLFHTEDQEALIAEVRRVGAKTALEFGPGESTHALIAAGCDLIDTFEHTEKWRRRAEEVFRRHPQVRIHAYANEPTVSIMAGYWDIAFVDSPVGQGRRRVLHPGQEDCSRFNTLLCAISRAPVVLLHDARRPGEQASLKRLAGMGCEIEMIETAKGIARITVH